MPAPPCTRNLCARLSRNPASPPTFATSEPSLYSPMANAPAHAGVRQLSADQLARLEPSLRLTGAAWYLPERCVDPRGLGKALTKTCKKRAVDFATGSEALEVLTAAGRAMGVRTSHATYHAGAVVNCAGAWAAKIQPLSIPTRPVKGQMVCVVPQSPTGAAGIPSPGIREKTGSARRPHARHLHHSPLRRPHSARRYRRRRRIRQAHRPAHHPASLPGRTARRAQLCRARAFTMPGPDFVPAHPTIFRFSARLRFPATSPPPDTTATASCSPPAPPMPWPSSSPGSSRSSTSLRSHPGALRKRNRQPNRVPHSSRFCLSGSFDFSPTSH